MRQKMTLHHDNLILLQYHIPKTKLLFSRRCADRLIHVLKIWLMPIRESCWDQRIMASKCQFCLTPQVDCKAGCHHRALLDPGRAVRSAMLPSASSGRPARRSNSPDTRCRSPASSNASLLFAAARRPRPGKSGTLSPRRRSSESSLTHGAAHRRPFVGTSADRRTLPHPPRRCRRCRQRRAPPLAGAPSLGGPCPGHPRQGWLHPPPHRCARRSPQRRPRAGLAP